MNFEYFKRIPLKKYTQIHLFKNSGYFSVDKLKKSATSLSTIFEIRHLCILSVPRALPGRKKHIHDFKNQAFVYTFSLFHTPTPDARRSDTRRIP